MPKTLLVVDDSRTIREAARLALAGEDWIVVAASTPDEALERLWSQLPSAVLCEADLGGAGLELCRTIRKLPGGRDLPLLLTGEAATDAAATATGATATLAKPFGAEELLSALASAVDTQGFSLDFDALVPSGEPPLSLAELDGPVAAPAPFSPSPRTEALDVEIIDLSGDDEFGELELIEDLEPLGPPPGGPSSSSRDDAAPARAQPPPFGAEDRFSPAVGIVEEAPVGEIDLDALFPSEPREGAAEAAEAGDEDLFRIEEPPPEPTHVGFATPRPSPSSGDAEVLRAESPFAYAEVPSSYEAPVEASVPREEPPGGGLTADTEAALRAALTHSLSLEALTPTVERVVERVAWEVVPRLAERLIREAIEKLQAEPPDH